MKVVRKDVIWGIALLIALIIAVVFMVLYLTRSFVTSLEAYQLHLTQRGQNGNGLYEGAGAVLLRLNEAGRDKAGKTLLVESRLLPYSDTSGFCLLYTSPSPRD